MNFLSIKYLCLLIIVTLCLSPLFAQIQFWDKINVGELKNVKLPIKIRTYSSMSVVREKPFLNSIIIEKLLFGTNIMVYAIIEGDLVRKTCLETPYKGCIKESNVWLHISFQTEVGKKREGFCSLTNFKAFSELKGTNQKFAELFNLEELRQYGLLWGSEIENWQLPQAHNESFLDKGGWYNFIAKIVLPTSELIISRKELEYIVRMSDDIIFKYSPEGVRIPEHWDDFPSIIQPIQFIPDLNALVIFENHAEFVNISYLEALTFFTFYPKDYDNSIPILYSLPSTLTNALAIVFLTNDGFQQIKDKSIIVKTEISNINTEDYMETTYTTTVDLNGDGQSEIVRFHSNELFLEFEEDDEYSSSYSIEIAMLHDSCWYLIALRSEGQDGYEGF